MIATILPMLLAGAPLSAADIAEIDAKVAEIFSPYRQDLDDRASWDYPIYSAEVTSLIAHWQKVVPADEPDRLNDGDWLCQCQDWDAEGFRVTLGPHDAPSPGVAEVSVRLDLGFGEATDIREARLLFRKEGADWRLDDIFAESFAGGLKQALRETIEEDEALAAAQRK